MFCLKKITLENKYISTDCEIIYLSHDITYHGMLGSPHQVAVHEAGSASVDWAGQPRVQQGPGVGGGAVHLHTQPTILA